MKADLFACFLALCLFGAATEAQTTWTGALSTSWSVPGNWDTLVVPTGTTDVIIAPAANQPSSFLVNPVCDDLTIQAGATLGLSGGFDLRVNGNLQIDGSLTVSSPTSQIEVTGNWTNDGAFSNGSSTVEFSGTGSVGGTSATTFNNLLVSGGARTLAVPIDVAVDVTIEGGATLDIGVNDHVVAGNWTSSAGGAVSGSGAIELAGNGLLTTGANSLPNVLVSAGVRAINTSSIAGDLAMTGGQIQILDSVTLSVGGNATLSGGTLGWDSFFGGAEVLDVDGDVTITAAAGNTSADSVLRCAGNWSSTSAFAPANGTVELDGGTAASVGGASPTFAHLRVVSGTKSVTAATKVANLTIESGGTLNASAALDVDGSVTLGATGAWGLGSSNHTVGGNWSSTGGSATGTGAVVFDGAGSLSTGGGSISNAVISAGTRTVVSSAISGNFSMLGGALEILDGQVLTVAGDLSLSVGTVSILGGTAGVEAIDVEGDVSITASAGTFSDEAQIRCAGNWSSSSAFQPADGLVRLDGGTVATVGGAGATFPDLNIESGTKTVVTPVTIQGNFTLFAGSTLDSDAAMDFDGNVTIGNATSAWDIGSSTHTIAGNFLALGGSALGTGTLELDGTGSLTSAGGDVSNMLVSAGTRTLLGTGGPFIFDVLGDLDMTGGELVLADNTAMRVGGDMSLTGGTLGFTDLGGGAEVLDVAGNVVLTATPGTMSANSAIFCAGDWSSDAAWTPSAGTVVLDPAVASTVGGAGTTFNSLRVASGTVTVSAAAAIVGDLTVDSGATLDTDAPLDIDGAVTLGDITAAWDVGASTHTVGGAYVSAGASASGAGKLLFDGAGGLNAGGASLPHVELASGARSAFSGTIAGDLTLSGGTLTIEADQTLHVTGNAALSSGTLAWATTGGTEVLDVDGDVTIAASAGATSAGSIVRCGGDWSSDATFAPALGTVELDGGSVATVGGTGPIFASLRVVSGTKTLLSAAAVTGDLAVDSGATLDANAALDVDGSVSLGATATLDVGGLTHTVAGDWTSAGGSAIGSGTLELDGPGVLATSTGSVPNVLLTAGLREVDDTHVTGDLELAGGELRVRNDQTLVVDGDATFAAGTLSWHATPDGTPEVIDVEGNVTATAAAGSTSADSELYAAGDWTSDGAFAPAAGTVYLDGSSPSLVDGTGITLARLVVRNNGRALLNTANAGELLVEAGATLQMLADLTVSGGATVAGGTLALGPQTISVEEDFTASDGGSSVTGTGLVRLTGTGTLSTGANSVPAVDVTGGQRAALDSVVAGNLTLSGGLLRIGDNQTLTVGGNASLSVLATLAFDDTSGGLETLDVAGTVVASATVVDATANTRIHCAGNWTSFSTFAPSDGLVVFDGGTTTTVGGPGVNLPDVLVASGTKTLTSALSADRLEVSSGAALIANAAANVDGDVVLGDGSASFDLGGLTHLVLGSWVSAGASATNGTVEFDGSGQLDTGGGSIANVAVSAGTRSVLASTVGGLLEMTAGELSIDDDQTLTVGGNADLSGGVLSFIDNGGGAETLDVAGHATISASAGTTSANTVIAVAGDWTSSASFAPAAGTVVLDGGTVASIDGSGIDLADLVIESGTKTLDAAATVANLTVQTGAALVTNATLDVDGAVTLGDGTASWDLGGGTHTVAGDWTSGGASATNGTVELDGPGVLVTGGGSIANARIAAGVRAASSGQIDGLLEMTGGGLTILADQTLAVGGNALLTSGVLSWAPVAGGLDEVLDVEGDVVCSASIGTVSSSSVLRCAGDWSSNVSFAPTAGRVVLDGAGTTSVAGLAPGFDPTFFQLVMRNGTRRSTSDHVLDVETFTIETTGAYEIEGATVTVPGTSILVSGTLALGTSGVLELGPTVALLTSATGTLSLVGTPANPAVITGSGGGGYLLTIDGDLVAGNFRFEQMGAAGIVVSNGATIGASPNDMRSGAFSTPSSAAGSVMLDIRRNSPTEFRYVAFEDPGAVGTFNVRVLSGAQITFTNASGNFAGPAFEQDPFNLVEWNVEETTLASYTATPAADAITLDWTTSLEADVLEFSVQRSTSPSGPFAEIAVIPAVGPSAYQHVDTTVTPQIPYYYDLVERKSFGPENVLGQDSAVAWSAIVLPTNFLTVGGSGSFATLQAAINAISGPLPVITVATGTYAPFTLGAGRGKLRILADGSGPVTIDTTSAAVLVQNLGATDSLEMSDFTIGDPLSPNAGIVVSNCVGVVVLDELVVHGGTGQPGIHVDGSARTAIQRTDADGTPGLLVDNGSSVVASNGTTDEYEVLGLSTLRTAQLGGTSSTEAGSTLIPFSGAAADLDVPEFVSLGQTFPATFSGEPGHAYVLVLAGDLGWLPLTTPWEMIGVFNFLGAITLNTGLLDGTGQSSTPIFFPGDGKFFGKPFVLTMVAVKLTPPFRFRWGNVATIIPVN